jgi:hypothetical protein
MPANEKTESPAILTEEEVYPLAYNVTFNNCTFNEKVTINQTGKPVDPGDPPPGGG